MVAGGGLVTGNRHMIWVGPPDVDPELPRRGLNFRRPTRHAHQHGIEEGVMHQRDSSGTESARQRPGVAVDPAGNRLEPVGAVVAGVHGGHHRQ